MKFLLTIALVVVSVSCMNACKDDTLCLTFMKESFDTYCVGFLKVPCPVSCGKCAADKLQATFHSTFKPDANGNVVLEDGIGLLKVLGINPDDAFVTELKDLVFDSKIAFTDLYQLYDADKNGELTVNEFLNGVIKFMEVLGVNFKPEMKSNVAITGDIARLAVGPKPDSGIPKLNEFLQSVMTKLDAVPHGLVTMIKMQSLNMTRDLDLSRIIVPSQASYTLDGKFLVWDLLDAIDVDDDGYVTLREVLGFAFMQMNLFSVTLPVEVHQNVNNYISLIENSFDILLKKYGFTDLSQLNDKVLPELNNQKFVDYRVKIQTAAAAAKQFTSPEVMKYLKTITNSLPQRKLTMRSIKEAMFVTLDKNMDFNVDIDEISNFLLVTLARIGANLSNADEVAKVFRLFDGNGDRKLDMMEFREMFKKPQV